MLSILSAQIEIIIWTTVSKNEIIRAMVTLVCKVQNRMKITKPLIHFTLEKYFKKAPARDRREKRGANSLALDAKLGQQSGQEGHNANYTNMVPITPITHHNLDKTSLLFTQKTRSAFFFQVS